MKIDQDLLMLRRTFTPKEREENSAAVAGMTERRIQRALYWKHRSTAQVMLPNYTSSRWYESDVLVVTSAGYTIEYEIKLSLADFKADFRNKSEKHKRLRDGHPTLFVPTRFYFVVPEMLLSPRDVPDYAGLVFMRFIRPAYRPQTLVRSVVQKAPRRDGGKVGTEVVRRMKEVSYYRFWNERMAFDDYIDECVRKPLAPAPE